FEESLSELGELRNAGIYDRMKFANEGLDYDIERFGPIWKESAQFDLGAAERVCYLSDRVGGLVLILDQFEEVLQGTDRQNYGLQGLVARLQRWPSIRVVLSLREEFRIYLHHLEHTI